MPGAGIGFTIGATLGASVAGAFSTVQDRLAKTRKALASATAESKTFARALELQQKRDALASQVKASGGQDQRAVAQLAKVSAQYREAKAAADAYGVSVKNWASQHAIAEKRLELTAQRMGILTKLQGESAKRGELMGRAMTTAMTAFAMAAPLKTGLEFEEAMSKVKAIAGASQQDLAAMTAQARELGGTTVWSAKQAAEGMTFLAMAGFNAQQSMAAMPGMLSLASAGAVDLGTTADIASNILSGFGFKADKMNYVGDVLAKTFTRSNTSLQSLGESMKYVAPTAAQAGQTFENTAAMIGKLGDAGIQGSEAGTGLNAIIARMSAPPKEARKAMDKLGLSMKDANGNMRDMPDVFAEIAAKSKNMGEVEKVAMAKALFGVNHFAKGLVLMSAAADGSLHGLAKGLYEEGYATRVAKEQTDNLSGDLKGLNSATEELSISLYTAVVPALRATTQWLTGVAQRAGAWAKENPQLTTTIMAVGAGLVAVKVAGLGVMFAMSAMRTLGLGLALAMNTVKIASVAWATATKAVAAGQWLLNAALTANPIGLIVVGVAGLIAAMVALYNNCEPVREAFDALFSFIFAGIKTVVSGFKAVASGIKKVVSFIPGFGGDDDAGEAEQEAQTPGTAKAAAAAAAAPVAKPKAFEMPAGFQMPQLPAGGGGAAAAAPSVTVPLSFNINGMPAQDFASGVMNAIQNQKDKLERVIQDIVNDQLRVAYAKG